MYCVGFSLSFLRKHTTNVSLTVLSSKQRLVVNEAKMRSIYINATVVPSLASSIVQLFL